MWEAQDANGDVYRYSERHELCGDQWVDMGGRVDFIAQLAPSDSWKESLIFVD